MSSNHYVPVNIVEYNKLWRSYIKNMKPEWYIYENGKYTNIYEDTKDNQDSEDSEYNQYSQDSEYSEDNEGSEDSVEITAIEI